MVITREQSMIIFYRNNLLAFSIRRRFVKHVMMCRIQDLYILNFFIFYQASIDKTLTKRTSKAIRSRIEDLLPEETGSKKPRLMESQQNDDSSILMSADPKIKQEFPGSCSSTSGPSPKPHLEEGNKIFSFCDISERNLIRIL